MNVENQNIFVSTDSAEHVALEANVSLHDHMSCTCNADCLKMLDGRQKINASTGSVSKR